MSATDIEGLVRFGSLADESAKADAKAGTWWRRTSLSLVAGLICIPFVADALAPVPNNFATGDTISAESMNET